MRKNEEGKLVDENGLTEEEDVYKRQVIYCCQKPR